MSPLAPDSSSPSAPSPSPSSSFFRAKKHKILSSLSVPESEYSDKSPKGSVDEPIRELIDLINSYPGWCTTSSCSGRVAVFVEGPKKENGSGTATATATATAGDLKAEDQDPDGVGGNDDSNHDDNEPVMATETTTAATPAKKVTKAAGPGGKGGGHWLFVSHSPLEDTANIDQLNILRSKSCTDNTTPATATATATPRGKIDCASSQRLIHLSFSPLILHVLCASLEDARPLLAAAINAGFRESGVPSLKVLEEPEKGVMVAIRTAGLAFGTVVGHEERENRKVLAVSEDYLRMCLGVINERFAANEERKRRLEEEIRKTFGRKEEQTTEKVCSSPGWVENKEDRRRRKREEGMKKQRQIEEERKQGLGLAGQGLATVDTAGDAGDAGDALLHFHVDEIWKSERMIGSQSAD